MDNTNLSGKIELRQQFLPSKKEINVLDCFAGNGILWKTIKKNNPDIKFNITSIDKKKGLNNIYLEGDNLKFIKAFDLTKYDIIDLDAYGSPYFQLKEIFKKSFKGHIFVTYIQIRMGSINKEMLLKLGYSKNMVDKIKTLFWRNPIDKVLEYINMETGVNKFDIISIERRNYLHFYLDK